MIGFYFTGPFLLLLLPLPSMHTDHAFRSRWWNNQRMGKGSAFSFVLFFFFGLQKLQIALICFAVMSNKQELQRLLIPRLNKLYGEKDENENAFINFSRSTYCWVRLYIKKKLLLMNWIRLQNLLLQIPSPRPYSLMNPICLYFCKRFLSREETPLIK